VQPQGMPSSVTQHGPKGWAGWNIAPGQ
jgi:hypothetical protein